MFRLLNLCISYINNNLQQDITQMTNTLIVPQLVMPLTLILLITPPMLTADCNFTHFEYYSKYSLGKQDQLNKTFTQISQYIRVPTIIYTANDTSKFTINNTKVTFNYIDSRQKAEIIGKDTIAVYGGYLELIVSFNWAKQNMMVHQEGTAEAKIMSEEILFEKWLQVTQGYLDYRLAYYYNVSFMMTNFTITRIDPAETPKTDIASISEALNTEKQTDSVKMAIQRQIANMYGSFLADNLKNEHYPLDDHFDYVYTNAWTGKKSSIPFILQPTGVDLENIGLSLTFVSYIKDYSGWKCGKAIPSEELNPNVYGGLQEFISFSVFQNTMKYAFQKGILDSELNRRAWQSRMFQFYAGDLYQVIPSTALRFMAQQQATGKCQGSPSQTPTLKKHNSTFINSTTSHICTIDIVGSKVAEFQIKLDLQIQIHSNDTYLNFKIVHAEGTPVFKTIPGFEVKNRILGEKMVQHSLNRLKQGWTFGSAWKIYPRDYSHVLVEDDFLVIYDSTHVQS